MQKNYIVAIDGTAASGKSTTARGAAQELGWFYLDTGAMYRAITYKIINNKIDIKNIGLLKELLNNTSIEFKGELTHGGYHICLDGVDVSKMIRGPEIDSLVSQVSAIPVVREKMVKEQQKAAMGKNTICEGRDISSVVFPNADLKFYLDCNLNERANRRRKDLRSSSSIDTVRNNLISRDYIDSNREVSPLVRVPDAIYLDTTNLTIEEEIRFIIDMIKTRLLHKVNNAIHKV
jgi:cytidylate kinase